MVPPGCLCVSWLFIGHILTRLVGTSIYPRSSSQKEEAIVSLPATSSFAAAYRPKSIFNVDEQKYFVYEVSLWLFHKADLTFLSMSLHWLHPRKAGRYHDVYQAPVGILAELKLGDIQQPAA